MKHRIKSADDVAWLLDHTHAFQGGQVVDVHIHKRRLLDEATGREVPAGTVITAVIRYDAAVRGIGEHHTITRVAKLLMSGATDFSIFEQEGADFSEIGVIHAEASGGRLRFWFDPHGELYVICDEAEIEEVSTPGPAKPMRSGMTEWTFQSQTGKLPAAAWFLEHLDRAGLPCAWRAVKRSAASHPTLRWEGYLVPASDQGLPQGTQTKPKSGIHLRAFGPLDGCNFVLTLRATAPHENGTGQLLITLADLIARSFAGTCLAGNQIMEGEEWLGDPGLGSTNRMSQPEIG
ncbi:MAG: hypothetical protein HY205_07720 [Nitrospirae bacterium]|nr:hypothetical protein [Nitrospirota bacterium]